MLLSGFPAQAPTPQAHRRFRLIVGALVLLALVLLLLQYTPHALLPARKTDTLWGVLLGMAGMGAFVDRRWAAAARRTRVG